MKKSEIIFGAIRLPIDLLAIIAAFFLAYYIRPFTDLIPGVQYVFNPELLPTFDEFLKITVYSTAFLIAIFIFSGMYSLKNTHKFSKEFVRIVVYVTAWLMFIIAYYFLVVHQLFFSRISLAHIWLFSITFISVGRAIMLLFQSFLLRYEIGQRRVLFVGISNLADQFYDVIKNDKRYKVVGAIADQHTSRKMGMLHIIGKLDQLEHIVNKYKIEEIIQADPNLNEEATHLHGFCRSRQIKYGFIPDLIRLQRANVEIEMFDNAPLISLKQTPLDGWGHIYKRIFDLFVSFILIILLIPLWIIISIIIKIDSKGSAFYKSARKYKNKIFNIYKFRTMEAGAHKKKKDLIDQNERSGPMFKIKNDPRVTKLGRFLRKTSIDELPQLFNVFIGNMSLVGPRPHLPEEVDQYESHHYEVFAIKPGITGIAQISGLGPT